MTDDIQSKIQKLELDTIRAVTELQKDVQSLTKEVANLAQQVQKMSENYVTVIKHNEDISEIKADLKLAKRTGVVRSILVGLFASVLTAIVTFEIMQFIK